MSNKTSVGLRRRDPEFDLRQIRKEIVQYCSGLPDLIRADAVSDDLASMALALGKCFCWIHHRLESYERQCWEPSVCEYTSVGSIGKQLWELGLELCKKRGSESPLELKVARLNLQLRSLEQIVLRIGGPGL